MISRIHFRRHRSKERYTVDPPRIHQAILIHRDAQMTSDITQRSNGKYTEVREVSVHILFKDGWSLHERDEAQHKEPACVFSHNDPTRASHLIFDVAVG